MAKKKAATKVGKKPAAKKPPGASVKKKKKGPGDLPGQKTMPHGPKKVPELESAGDRYRKASAAVDQAKEKLKNAEGVVFDLLKKKRHKAYTVAGYTFARVSNGEKLSVTKASKK